MGIFRLIWNLRSQIGVLAVVALIATYILMLKVEISSLSNKVATSSAQLVAVNADLLQEKARNVLLQSKLDAMTQEGERKKKNAEFWKSQYEGRVKDIQITLGLINGFSPKDGETDCQTAARLLKGAKR